MINSADYNARGWEVANCFADRLSAAVVAEMSSHEQAPGLSSVGTRNILHAFTLSMKPKVVVEVGAHIGSAAVAIGSALKVNKFGTLFSLEPQDHYFELLSYFVRKLELSDYVTPLQMFSTDSTLASRIGEKADMIYLDANHSYSHVLNDLAICDGLLADNGLLFLDDVGSPHSGSIDSEGRGGVRKALLDFTGERPNWHVTFLEHPFWLNPCGLAIAVKQSPLA